MRELEVSSIIYQKAAFSSNDKNVRALGSWLDGLRCHHSQNARRGGEARVGPHMKRKATDRGSSMVKNTGGPLLKRSPKPERLSDCRLALASGQKDEFS